MKHYVFVTEMEEKQRRKIYNDFKSIYKVDLDDKKYDGYDSIEKEWDAIIGDTFLERGGKTKEIYVQKFMQLLYLALYGEQSDIVRPYSIEVKRRQDIIQEFKIYLKEMQSLLDDYSMYEPDVWMNVYLSIQYIKAIHNLPDDENIVTSVIEMDEPYHVTAKGVAYTIPFEEYQEGFCEEYLKKIAGKDQIQILGASIDSNKKEYINVQKSGKLYGMEKRVKLDLGYGMKYTRWSQKKVYSLEKSKEFGTEDKVMFHKTINGVLVRNLVDTMISTEHMYDVEDYLYLLDKLCISKSLSWQNLIGCLYVEVSCLKRELTALGLWGDIEVMFEAWFVNLEAINYRLELLVKGLIYVIYKQDSFFNNVTEAEEKCKDALEKIEKNPVHFSEKAEKLICDEWAAQEKELHVSKGVETNHRQYYWIYAIMQRYVIDSLTPCICNKLRERERDWNDVVESIASIAEVYFDVNGNRSDKGSDNIMEDGKENIKVDKICIDVLNRKQEEDKCLTASRITKKDLLSEIKCKLIEAGVEDDNGKISIKQLGRIWKKYITLKAGEKHINFKINYDKMKCGYNCTNE